MNIRATIQINGIVQGVGFRPFVYRIAKEFSLTGYVLNLGDAGVRIVVEGKREAIQEFLDILKTDPPSIARIDSFKLDWEDTQGQYDDFVIEKSSITKSEESEPVIPPDIAMCECCEDDLSSQSSRWKDYPFTSCAACGPRFSTITDLPYDRPNTTMKDFPLCDTCNTGYTNPMDRRYHAQTTACAICGPTYHLRDGKGNNVVTPNPILTSAEYLKQGEVLAVQGISGTHLVTITSSVDPITKLRQRKQRLQRPFAIMVRDLETLERNFILSEAERKLLISWKRPIVLVRKRMLDSISSESVLSVLQHDVLDEIAPGLDTVGVMLPYAPVHHLLFRYLKEPALVMTSANHTGVPMYIDPSVIVHALSGIADHFLLHNRGIHQRADDSVIKFIDAESPLFIRRARGYTPEPILIDGFDKSLRVLGVGPEEKAMATILKSGILYPTQYIGDTDNVENIEFLENAYRHLADLIGLQKFDAVACDLHPEFLSTLHAERISADWKVPLYRVQHHHAHLASILADHNLKPDTSIICITADGYGYGADKTGWGGEILLGDSMSFENKAGLRSYVYPGGDLSAKYGVRPLIGMIKDSFDENEIVSLVKGHMVSDNVVLNEAMLPRLLGIIDKGINTITTSSAGRFLDAVATVLGVCDSNTYDGECPMKLEAIAKKTDFRIEPHFLRDGNRRVIDTADSIQTLIHYMNQGMPVSQLAYAAQWFLGHSFASLAIEVAEQEGIGYIGFSGGVALNHIITEAIVSSIKSAALTPLVHRRIPPGDGGVSIGQVMVGASHLVTGI